MMRSLLFSVAVVAAACGGKAQPATSTVSSEPAGNHGGEHHHDFPAELGAFHDKLAPLWHADTGQARIDQTCMATGELDALAANVKQAPPPTGVDPIKWGVKADALVESVFKLSATCGEATRATFEPDFQALHSAFHGMIELLPATAEDKAADGKSDLGVDPK
jgi:hypothetical protein